MNYELNGKQIEIQILRKKNKNIYLRFLDCLTLQVTCNHFISDREILKIIKRNEESLKRMLKQKEQEASDNEYFLYLGKKFKKVFDGTSKNPNFHDEQIWAKDEKTLDKFYASECLRLFQSEMNRILPWFPNIPPFDLKIRNMKTRWGVNNQGSKTITLNSELLKKDLDLLDYVIIHELCHFYEPNHSKAFWNHVEEYFPKYKEARKRLRG